MPTQDIPEELVKSAVVMQNEEPQAYKNHQKSESDNHRIQLFMLCTRKMLRKFTKGI